MKRIIFTLSLLTLIGAGVITPVIPTYAQTGSERLVIKNGSLQVQVGDTDAAVTTALRLAEGLNGYTLSQQIWEDDARYRYADITFGIPAANFEQMLNALKTLGTVQDEWIAGEDVTDAAVDLNSRLDNLHSNQERVRVFLDQTRYMTETLDVHDQLTRVEGEIGDLQGQENYLADRAAVATLTLHLVPLIPTPMPVPTATPTPLPTPQAWHPADTAQLATVRLTETTQSVVDFGIYRLIIWLPRLLLLLLLSFVIRGVMRHFRRPSAG
ncbi:MAG: DUF4349 domain-containing protein [Chloroflexi bacterium]|nr:DUF4349 domain-containing protein [Chloroflexota bacterium]